MARNEYSRRTKKDIFWGDDDDNKGIPDEENQLDFDKPSEADLVPAPTPEPPKYEPVQKPTPPKYEPPKPSQSADGILGDLNIDKFISDNSDEINNVTTSKITSIVIWIAVAVLVAWWLGRWVAAIALGFLGYAITKSSINSKYKKLISRLVNKIDAVKSFYKSGIRVPLNDMMLVKNNGGSLSINTEDMLTLNVGDNDVSIEEFAVIETEGKEQNCLYTGLYAVATLKSDYADGIIIRHGSRPIPSNKYPQRYAVEPLASRYTILAKDNVDFAACDFDRIAALADNVRTNNDDKPFILLLQQGKVHFIADVKDLYTFDYGFLDDAKDCIRRDIREMAKRVKIARAMAGY